MNNAFSKILSFMETEGIVETLRFVKNSILSRIGLRLSETYFYRYSIKAGDKFSKPEIHPDLQDINFAIIKSKKEFDKFKPLPKKMNFIPVEEWFKRGSICLALILHKKIVAYTWVHFNYYDNLGAVGILHLEKNEVFTGPDYTDTSYRKRGLSYLLMYHRLQYMQNNAILYVFGSSNSVNIAPIKYFINSGFELIGCVKVKRFSKKVILEFHREHLLKKRLR